MKMKTIEEYAKLGEQYSPIEALTLLTKAYIKMCGYSLGYRTIVYCAAEAWQERLAWLNLPLSEMARKEPLVLLMPHIQIKGSLISFYSYFFAPKLLIPTTLKNEPMFVSHLY